MSIALIGVEARHGFGIRLIFSNTLDTGAFGILPSLYTVVPTDSMGVSTLVKAAVVVPGSPTNVELILGTELVRGAAYKVTAVGVPATDLSVTPAGSELPFMWGDDLKRLNVESVVSNRELLLYKADLLWNQVDFQETPTGDLARVTGSPNVSKAIYRAINASGRNWDGTYGAKLGEFVDSPSSASGTMRGNIVSATLRDPRVASAKVTFEVSGDKTYAFVSPVLISGEAAKRVTITVPNQ